MKLYEKLYYYSLLTLEPLSGLKCGLELLFSGSHITATFEAYRSQWSRLRTYFGQIINSVMHQLAHKIWQNILYIYFYDLIHINYSNKVVLTSDGASLWLVDDPRSSWRKVTPCVYTHRATGNTQWVTCQWNFPCTFTLLTVLYRVVKEK